MVDGVMWYTHKVAIVDVFFPEGRVCCKNCPLFLKYENMGYFNRYSCKLTGELVDDPVKGIAPKCPLIDYEQEDESK